MRIKCILTMIILILISIPSIIYSQGKGGVIISEEGGDEETSDERMALVIGINDYLNPSINDLKYATEDAYAMEDILEDKGYFTVKTLIGTDALKYTINNHLEYIEDEVRYGEIKTFLMFFSGHGFEINGVKYLATYDIDPSNIENTSLNYNKLENRLEKLRRYGAKIMVFIDACRNDPYVQKPKGSGDVSPFTDEYAEGYLSFFSTSEGTYSYEFDELGHGVFTYFLLRGLDGDANKYDDYISFFELSDYVAKEMRRYLLDKGVRQEPRVYASDNIGDFYITIVDESDDWDDDVVVTNEPPPGPSWVDASNDRYPDKIKVEWAYVQSATKYKIYRKDENQSDYEYLNWTSKTYYYDYDVKPVKKYYYAIQAVNEYGESYQVYTSGRTSEPPPIGDILYFQLGGSPVSYEPTEPQTSLFSNAEATVMYNDYYWLDWLSYGGKIGYEHGIIRGGQIILMTINTAYDNQGFSHTFKLKLFVGGMVGLVVPNLHLGILHFITFIVGVARDDLSHQYWVPLLINLVNTGTSLLSMNNHITGDAELSVEYILGFNRNFGLYVSLGIAYINFQNWQDDIEYEIWPITLTVGILFGE
jgi:hypothetical protein